MSFEPKRHMMRVQGGREYLPVSARLIWFRDEHPDWGIVTTPVEINMEKQYAIFSAQIFNEEGRLMATGTKMENVKGFGDWIEKAETGAIGRALAMCGYGTQFAPELEEGPRLADAPYPMNGRPGQNNRPGNFGGGMNRPSAPQQRPAPPRPAPAPPAAEPEAEREEAPPAPHPLPERENAPAPPAPARPAIVREPVRSLQPEPPDVEDDDEDPFAETDEAPARPAAPPARAAAARADAAPAAADNVCTVDGCNTKLSPGQLTMSMTKFGKALCPQHQRDAQPVNGQPKRPAPAETLL